MVRILLRVAQRSLLAFFGFACLLSSSAANADRQVGAGSGKETALSRILSAREIVIGMKKGDSKPFFYHGVDGVGGLDVRIAKAVADELGVSCRIQRHQTFDDVIKSVRIGDVDVGISKLSITPDRSATVLFTNPYAVFRHGLVVNRKSLLKATKDGQEDVVAALRRGDLRLGVVRGSYEAFARAQFAGRLQLQPFDDWQKLVEGVAKNGETSSVDAAYRDEFEIQKALSEDSELALFVRPYAFTDSADRIAMAVNQADIHLKFWLDEFLVRFIRTDPIIREVLAQRREKRRALLFKIVSIKDRLAAEQEFMSSIQLDYYDVDAILQLYRTEPDVVHQSPTASGFPIAPKMGKPNPSGRR